MDNSKKNFDVKCCIGILMKFEDQDFKILRIADISTKEWNKKGRVNTIGTIYTKPENGHMLIPIKLEGNTEQWGQDAVGVWVWKESNNSEDYAAIPYSRYPKPPCKYNYYELIFLQNPENSSESRKNMGLVVNSDDKLAQILEKGITVPDTFSENLLVIYDCDEEHYFCAEINRATSCLRYNDLLFVTDRKSLERYKIQKTDIIDSFDPLYKNATSENSSGLTRRLIYKKMKFSQQDRLDPLALHTDSTRFAGYVYRIASRLNYSEDEKKLVNKIIAEAQSNPKEQQIFTLYPENKQWFESQIDIINKYLNTDDKVGKFVRGVIENIPKINEEYIGKIQHIANQGLLQQKTALETEINNLKNTIEEQKGELLAINADKTAEKEALKSLKKRVESEGEKLRADQESLIKQELHSYKEDQKKIVDEELAVFKKEQKQKIIKESEQFRVDQQNAIQKDLESLREEDHKIQEDIASLKGSKKQLEKEISEKKQIQEEISQLEQKKKDLKKTNDELKVYCEQKLKKIQNNPGDFLGDFALFRGIIPSGEYEKRDATSSPNSGLFVQPAKRYRSNQGSDPIESADVENLIYDLKENLQNIGVDYEYAENLATLIAGAYLTRTPLLLAGCKANLMANAISITLHSQTPEIISVPTGYNDYSSLLKVVKNTKGNVVLLQNAIGSIDEYCYTHLAKDIVDGNPEKYIIFSLDFTENMRILPSSVLGYMVLINSEDVITSIEIEDLNPGDCTIGTIGKRNINNVQSLYQRVSKISQGLNTTNGYNLTRSTILTAVAKKDEENVDAVIILELASYCKLLGITNELNQRVEYLNRKDLKRIVDKLLGGE